RPRTSSVAPTFVTHTPGARLFCREVAKHPLAAVACSRSGLNQSNRMIHRTLAPVLNAGGHNDDTVQSFLRTLRRELQNQRRIENRETREVSEVWGALHHWGSE